MIDATSTYSRTGKYSPGLYRQRTVQERRGSLKEALTALHHEEEGLVAIMEGIEDEAAGRIRPWEEVNAELDAKFGFGKP